MNALDEVYVTGQLGQALDALRRYLVELAVQSLQIVGRKIVFFLHELRGERVQDLGEVLVDECEIVADDCRIEDKIVCEING